MVLPAANWEILRGDLASLFYNATKAYTEYIFDDSITALKEDPAGVTVCFMKHPDQALRPGSGR